MKLLLLSLLFAFTAQAHLEKAEQKYLFEQLSHIRRDGGYLVLEGPINCHPVLDLTFENKKGQDQKLRGLHYTDTEATEQGLAYKFPIPQVVYEQGGQLISDGFAVHTRFAKTNVSVKAHLND